MSHTSSQPLSADVRSSVAYWMELLLVVLIAFAALGLRAAWPDRMAVEHFDEGVYASNMWFNADEGYRYPDRHLYAPPLLPWLIEWAIVLFGPANAAIMSVNVLAGGATALLAWWAARGWFGREAGVAAAALAALSDFHLLYSRTALTDVLLCFWILLAVVSFWKGCCAESPRGNLLWGVMAGTATGLAWWTKYNGWLPLAIGLAGLFPWALHTRPKPADIRCKLLVWLAAAVTAGGMWMPVLNSLQPYGGYSVVAANHRRYLVGVSGWWKAFGQQVDNHWHWDGWLSVAALGLAVALAALIVRTSLGCFTWNATESTGSQGAHPQGASRSESQHGQRTPDARPGQRRLSIVRVIAVSSGLVACAAWLGSSVTLGILAVAGIVLHLAGSDRGAVSSEYSGSDRSLAAWLLVAWYGGLLLATPLYHPYPRLTLPWLMAAWLGAAAAIGWLIRYVSGMRSNANGEASGSAVLPRSLVAGALLLSTLTVIAAAERLTSRGIPGWQSRARLQTIAADVLGDVRTVAAQTDRPAKLPADFIIYVYAEPGLFFHLARFAADDGIIQPAGNLGFVHPEASHPDLPTFLVVGPHARRSPQFRRQWSLLQENFRPAGRYPYPPSDLVLLNFASPSRMEASGPPAEDIRLYLLR